MKRTASTLTIAVAIVAAAGRAPAVTYNYAGTDYDIGGTFFPGGTAPYVVAPWRSNDAAKAFDIDGNNVYGSAGYVMFATQYLYPNAGCCGSSAPYASATYPNLESMPSWIAGTQNLTTNKVGGWNYALVDDPTQTNGPRNYNWGQSLAPPVNGQVPHVKPGTRDGNDIWGNTPATTPAGRWAFTVGPNAPAVIRVGVMTDGLDDTHWAASEVVLAEVTGMPNPMIVGSATSGTVTRNRFIDIHTFDIVGAQAGDTFAIMARAASGGFGAISAVTFDVVPEPTTAGLTLSALAALAGWRRRRV